MSLVKRHIGRRVAGVGVAVTLMVLGLQAPAFADPAVSGISPTSGPVDCVVVITGTGFDLAGDLAIDEVAFTATVIGDTPADFHVVSDTEIWTTVPTGAATGAIRVTDVDGNFSDSAVFTVTTGTDTGGCAPTITSFEPTCGVVGSVVTITGTNLLASSGEDVTPTAPEGGDVQFNPYTGAPAIHTGAAESPTTLVVNVEANAVDGPIRVITPVDTVDSTTPFDVAALATDCVPPTPTSHARSISFKITKAGKASGVVSSTEDPAFTDCVAAVPVKIQRKKSGVWKTVGKTTTNDSGAYTKKVKNPKGTQKFRALAPKVSLGDPVTDVCTKARSAVRKK
jgi:IPT/TIG domain